MHTYLVRLMVMKKNGTWGDRQPISYTVDEFESDFAIDAAEQLAERDGYGVLHLITIDRIKKGVSA